MTNKSNVLLVDDDASVSRMLAMLLETRGYAVDTAESGKEALSKVSRNTDIILLDLTLPDRDGFDVCRRLKEAQTTRHIPIIILSARLLSEDIVEGLYMGADDYLTKPFEYEELIARIEAVKRRARLFRFGEFTPHGEKTIILELRQVIEEERVTPFFQPIVHIDSMKIYGFEALCRPNADSLLSNPELLFKAAIEFGFYQDLESLSWRKALLASEDVIGEYKLFLNCNPYLVQGSKFAKIESIFTNTSINPSDVVLELTERSAIKDFSLFYTNLNRYRNFGFRFAVDDVGGGFASLESIVKTRPEIVKIDRHIVSDLEQDPYKKSIIKFIVAFCKENDVLSIAEGIESKEDLTALQELGVDLVQGYYLCKPTPELDVGKMQKVIQAC